ncbi:MAG TPA: hypothetical protein VE890_13720 [Thermoguttaceae bacterium]|nr:hypothetical protein [Thermoguttaceae bacterium]
MASWLLFGLRLYQFGETGAKKAKSGTIRSEISPPVEPLTEGPWGRLVCRRIALSPLLDYVPEMVPWPDKATVWRFPNLNSTQVESLLTEIGLPEELRTTLLSMAEVDLEYAGLMIRPTPEIILALDPETRASLYVALDASMKNVDQGSAFRFYGDSFDQWIGQTSISQATRALVEPLIYRHGGYLFFADLRTVEAILPSEHERVQLIKALSHQSTYMVQLKLSETSNLDALVEYWGRGGRAKNVAPILESVIEGGGDRTVDITYLLPSFARERIYTYPFGSEMDTATLPDCHWTALNFFSDEPDDSLSKTSGVVRTLQEDYYRIFGNPKLGDLVLYLDASQTLMHSAVYIADDILFTKNGTSLSQPWMLVKVDEMKGFYPRRDEVDIHYYRRKDL